MKTNHVLAGATVVLLVLSGWTYHESVTRAERFERGQKLLPNLNPDEIAEIVVKKGDDETHLRRQGDEFVIVNADGYPAANDSVNRFIRDVLELSLEKKVGSGEDLEKELELGPDFTDTVEVVFKNANEKEMVHFFVGKGAGDGGGNFVVRADGEDRTVYLTSSGAYLRAEPDGYLKKEIVDVKADDVIAITGPDYRIVKAEEGDAYELEDLPAGKKQTSKVASAKSMLAGLRFTKHYLRDADEVAGLDFDYRVQVELDDDSGYQVALAEKETGDGTKHYLQIQGFHNAQELMIARDAGDEEVKQTADTLARIDELNKFNDFQGSWTYEIPEYTAKKIRLERKDLMEDA